jgi:hypothetical protein
LRQRFLAADHRELAFLAYADALEFFSQTEITFCNRKVHGAIPSKGYYEERNLKIQFAHKNVAFTKWQSTR